MTQPLTLRFAGFAFAAVIVLASWLPTIGAPFAAGAIA